MVKLLRYGFFILLLSFQGADIMPEYLRIRNDLIQKFGIGQNGIVDVSDFLFVPKTFQKFEVSVWQSIQVFAASIIRSQLGYAKVTRKKSDAKENGLHKHTN
jgi:hypothetical protein